MEVIFPALLFSLIASPAFAGKSILCKEFDVDNFEDNTPVSITSIQLNNRGQAVSLSHRRRAYEGSPRLELKFSEKNSRVSHSIKKNEVVDFDEEAKKPIYLWNIEDIEVIEFTSANGQIIKIEVNDHLYSGDPGSSIHVNSKKSPYNVDCSGAVKLPMAREK
jgi:hypothetical protein